MERVLPALPSCGLSAGASRYLGGRPARALTVSRSKDGGLGWNHTHPACSLSRRACWLALPVHGRDYRPQAPGTGARGDVEEDTALVDPSGAIPADGEARRCFFADPEHLRRYCFDPALEYCFNYYQHYFVPVKCCLDLRLLQLDLSRLLHDQPILLSMAKDIQSGEYLWCFELWHRALLYRGTASPPRPLPTVQDQAEVLAGDPPPLRPLPPSQDDSEASA